MSYSITITGDTWKDVQAKAAVLTGARAASPAAAPEAAEEPAGEEAPAKRGPGRPRKETAPAEDDMGLDEPAAPAKTEAKEITLDDLRGACRDFSKKNGTAAMKKILERFDVTSLNDLKKKEYKQLIDAVGA